MKDIYETLNDTDLDFKDVKDMDVDELEKKRGKKKLMNSIGKQKKSRKKQIVAASLAIAAVVSVFTANPALAQNIPFIGDLIQRDLVSINSKYEDYISVIGETNSYNGIDITFENAVVDKNALFLSFTVKSENKITEDINTWSQSGNFAIKINGEDINGSGESSSERIDDNSFKVLRVIDLNYDILPENMNIQLLDNERNMDIKFAVKTKDIEAKTTVTEVNKSIIIDGKECFVQSISVSPLVTEIKYYVENPNNDDNYDSLLFNVTNQDGSVLKESTGRSTRNGCDDYIDGRNDYAMKFISTENMESLKLVPKLKGKKYEDKAITIDLK